MFDFSKINEYWQVILVWLQAEVLTAATLVQLVASVAVLIMAKWIANKPKTLAHDYFYTKWDKKKLNQYNEEALISLVFPVIALGMIWLVSIVSVSAGITSNVILIMAKLLTAWVVIRLTTTLVRFPLWSKVIATMAWSVAALSITNLLEPTSEMLNSFAFQMGDFNISVLTVFKGIFSLVITLWVAGLLSKIIERKINKLPNVTPSVRVLVVKIFKITLVVFALLIALDSLGIDLTALTVFGGAIGLGLGFGLQKVVSNLISGFILLMDHSVKPGDVIEIDGTYGWVNKLGGRCVSVLTRDGVEHLIPNEHLIAEKVINWSYSSPNIRLKIPMSIAYNSDVHRAMELVHQAADETDRVLKDPAPACRLVELGDSGINMELRIWIGDPQNGIVNIRSAILLAILDKFRENDIDIPFPQKDVNIKLPEEVEKLVEKVVSNKFSG